LRWSSYGIFWLVIVASLLLPIFSKPLMAKIESGNETILKRLSLTHAAGRMISERPFLGEGAGNFIVELPKKSNYPASAWWLQPVHNIFLLTFSEAGIVGLLIFIFILFSALGKSLNTSINLVFPLLFIVLTGSLDHYWLTLQQNQLMLGLVLGLSFRRVRA